MKWLKAIELKNLSYSYIHDLRQRTSDHIIPFFKSVDVSTIRTYSVEQFYQGLLKKKLSSKTVKHILDTLRLFLNYMLRLEVLDRLPLFPEHKATCSKEKAWIDAPTQIHVLSFIAAPHRLIFETLFESGRRPSEICALKKKDLKDDGIEICRAFDKRGFIKTTKEGKTFQRPLSPALYLRLQACAALSFPEAWLFMHKKTHYNRNIIYKLWIKGCRKARLNISLYNAVRHSRASQKRRDLEASMREELRKELCHTRASTTLKHYALEASKEVKV